MSSFDKFLLWIAQGFGSGRLKPGPGTWGSGVGLLLAIGLLRLPPWMAALAALLLTVLAVPICAAGERILGRKDPGSVVFDEIVALPWVFLPVVWKGSLGRPEALLSGTLPVWAAGFVLFRVFDIWKPWPIRPLQNFHGGLGVVADDIAAALLSGMILVPLSWALAHS
jgi:phosphatidylglycerophosphatase A